MKSQKVLHRMVAKAASDGAGVNLMRVFGGGDLVPFDPFLMLDEFGSAEASDYVAGFPSHPHRGFETITYMLQGKMEHRDHLGNIGLIQDGDVQWMTAGKGIIHSEMPKQTEGRMHGFQIWLNLPSHLKMQPSHYRDVPAAQLPTFESIEFKVIAIAGEGSLNGNWVRGYFNVEETQAVIWDIHLSAGAQVHIDVPSIFNILMYVYDGCVACADELVSSRQMVLLQSEGGVDVINKMDLPARFLWLSGKPINEPIVQYGPFVMNTQKEIEQAILEFRNGVLTEV